VGQNPPKNLKFILNRNFPNPFQKKTVIKFITPINTHITLKVYDILGRVVATLLDQPMTAGGHDVDFDSGDLPTGVYFYQIRTGDGRVMTKKMAVMK
jgi:hypothetical protein